MPPRPTSRTTRYGPNTAPGLSAAGAGGASPPARPSSSISVGKRARMRSASAGWRAAKSSTRGSRPARTWAVNSSANSPSSAESSVMVPSAGSPFLYGTAPAGGRGQNSPKNPRSVGGVVVLRVFQHLAARLLALAALVGAFLHHLVVLDLVAGLAAALARLGAGNADQVRVRPAAGGDRRRGRAMGCAVLARLQRGKVLLLAVGDHLRAVGAAGVAHAGAVVARFRALHHRAGVGGVRVLRVGFLVLGGH